MSARASLAVSMALVLSGCCLRPSLQTRVDALERENEQLRLQVEALDESTASLTQYAGELAQSAAPGPAFSMAFTRADLETLARQTVPYRIDASEFNRDLSGTVVVDRVSGFALLPGNRLACRMQFHGENVQWHGAVPPGAGGMIEEFTAGVAAGVLADLDVFLLRGPDQVRALVHVSRTQMLRNSRPLFEDNLRDAMNASAFRNPIAFDARVQAHPATLTGVWVTGNHVVVEWAPR